MENSEDKCTTQITISQGDPAEDFDPRNFSFYKNSGAIQPTIYEDWIVPDSLIRMIHCNLINQIVSQEMVHTKTTGCIPINGVVVQTCGKIMKFF